MIRLGLLALSLIICSLNQVACEVYYITTNSNDCTVHPCRTLSEFAANTKDYLRSNTTLVFFPGTHHLSKVNLTLSNVGNLVINSENYTAKIVCASDSHIHFSQSQYIHIYNLEFNGCGGNQVRDVEQFVVEDTKFEGRDNSGAALELNRTTAQIINSTFVSNSKGKCVMQFFSYRCRGGAMIATNSTVSISQGKFIDNRADDGGAIVAEQNSIINMSDNVFINNNAIHAGGEGGVVHSRSSTITIKVSEFHKNSANYAGGVLFSSDSTITIVASEFHDSFSGDGGVLAFLSSYIIIEASEFINNTAPYRAGVLLSLYSTLTIQASAFYDNNASDGGVLNSFNSTITIEGSKFHNNGAYRKEYWL